MISLLQESQVFSLVDPSVYAQLSSVLRACLQDSNGILALEQRIKHTIAANQFGERLFLTLCALFLTLEQDPQVQWVASIILKNLLKEHLPEIKQGSP